MKDLKVLAPYDGMACGMLALKRMDMPIKSYVAFEIDKYAIKTSSHNFPEIEHRGDVFEADFKEFDGTDILMGGSPCTHWSIAQRKGREVEASGIGWELFKQYVRAIEEAKPKYFIYENNKSMSDAIRESITETFGFEPICINSALVSAQNRQRLYWIGKRTPDGKYIKVDVQQPEDRGILLKDILDDVVNTTAKSLTDREMDYMVRETSGVRNHFDFGYIQNASRDKGACLTANVHKEVPYNVCCQPIRIGCLPSPDGVVHGSRGFRLYDINGKSVNLIAQGGGLGAKTGLYVIPSEHPVYVVKDGMITVRGKEYPIKIADGYYVIRKLTVDECKRLQTVPEWYEFPVSDTQAYKMLGNGWTVDVIAHILSYIRADMEEIKA